MTSVFLVIGFLWFSFCAVREVLTALGRSETLRHVRKLAQVGTVEALQEIRQMESSLATSVAKRKAGYSRELLEKRLFAQFLNDGLPEEARKRTVFEQLMWVADEYYNLWPKMRLANGCILTTTYEAGFVIVTPGGVEVPARLHKQEEAEVRETIRQFQDGMELLKNAPGLAHTNRIRPEKRWWENN